MRVDDIADVRSGDKGDTLILGVFPRGDTWSTLREHLTAEAVAAHFQVDPAAGVLRTELPLLPGLVFRLPRVLGGGVTSGRHLDGHGKTLGYHLLGMQLPDPR
jgi:hypothetical protein